MNIQESSRFQLFAVKDGAANANIRCSVFYVAIADVAAVVTIYHIGNIYQEPISPVQHRSNNRLQRFSEQSERANNFRLHEMKRSSEEKEAERDKRANVAKEYQHCINVMLGFAYGLDFAAVGLGTTGILLLTTVVATPIVMAMEGIALATGGLSTASNLICDKVLAVKTKKHIQIRMLAKSKLNTINDHISKVLKDGYI